MKRPRRRLVLAATALGLCVVGVFVVARIARHRAPRPAILAQDTTWRAEDGVHDLKQGLMIPAGRTLTLEAGAHARFGPRAALVVAGTLLVRGIDGKPVVLDALVPPRPWAGLRLEKGAVAELSRLRLASGGLDRALIVAQGCRLVADHLQFEDVHRGFVFLQDASIDISDTDFPSVGAHEAIHGYGLSREHPLTVRRCTFHPARGFHDNIDVARCDGPGVVGTLEDLVFDGGSDDGVDTDSCHLVLDRCTFRKFHQQGHHHLSSGISAGMAARVEVRDCTFTDCDYGLTIAESALVTVTRSTIASSRFAALSLEEGGWPGAVILIDCTLCANPATAANRDRALRLDLVRTTESADCPVPASP
jgi:hypothetical protein